MKTRVILVDDRTDNLTALEAALKGLDAVLVPASSGEEALRHLLDGDAACVLLDVRMPGMDGFETARLIRGRAATRHLPIIFVTGFEPAPEETSRAYALGAVDFVCKPAHPDALRAKVAFFVDFYRHRRLAEKHRSDEQLRLIVEGSLDAVVTMDERGAVTGWNGQAETMFGWSEQEILGRSLADHLIPPKYRDAHRKGMERMRATGEGPILGKRIEITALRRDGSEFPVELAVTPLRSDGSVSFSAFIRDLSERRSAERVSERLAAVVRDSQDAIVTKTLDGTITTWNQGAERIFGYAAAEVIGKPITILIPDGLFDEEAMILGRISRGERVESYETRRRRKDGSTIDVSLTVSPLRDHEGRIVGASKIGRDITERKRIAREDLDRRERVEAELEEKIRERTAKLTEALRELEAFSYTVAHDLRAPLRAMTGFGRILIEDHVPKSDEAGQDYARRIVTSSKRMDAMVQDLLEYSRVARQELSLQKVDLGELVREILSTTDGDAAITVEEPFPAVRAHRGALAQAITNLVQNAVKFVLPGKAPEIIIRSEVQGDRVLLWVEDRGIGIAPEHHERIFGVFHRLHDDQKYPGTGIGLAIVRKSMERMGGKVGLRSEPGQGSRFWLELKKEG